MAHRNRAFDIVTGVVQYLALLILAAASIFLAHQLSSGVNEVLLSMIVSPAVFAVGFAVVRRAEQRAVDVVSFPKLDSLSTSETQPDVQNTPGFMDQLRSIDWFQFEAILALAYRRRGYNVFKRGDPTPDGTTIDLVIEMAGQQTAVQCRHWKTRNVGLKAVREFLGAVTGAGMQKGIFITLCGHTFSARQFADKHRIKIMNELELAQVLEPINATSDPEVLSILRP